MSDLRKGADLAGARPVEVAPGYGSSSTIVDAQLDLTWRGLGLTWRGLGLDGVAGLEGQQMVWLSLLQY